MAQKKQYLDIKGNKVKIISDDLGDYICLTDMVQNQEVPAGEYIRRWLRTGPTIEFLGVWEQAHNEVFNLVLWNQIKSQYTNNAFIMSVKRWLETDAVGIRATAGRYGGTYAHFDIAIHFANWFSAEFYVYFIKDYERLKIEENQRIGSPMGLSRDLIKVYYKLQTSAIEKHLIPPMLKSSSKKISVFYTSEADIINQAVFGMTAKEWKTINPQKKGNQRDHATLLQHMILGALEVLDSKLIAWGCDQTQRIEILNETATEYLTLIPTSKAFQDLKALQEKQQKKLDS
jgi:KilA domain-containing protein